MPDECGWDVKRGKSLGAVENLRQELGLELCLGMFLPGNFLLGNLFLRILLGSLFLGTLLGNLFLAWEPVL